MDPDEKICPQCAETIKKAALICRYCRHEFPRSESVVEIAETSAQIEAQPTDAPTWVVLWIGLGVLGLVILAILTIPGKGGGSSNDAAIDNLATDNLVVNTLSAETNTVVPEPPPTPVGWEYSDRSDELRGEKIYRASIDSENKAYFDFPYGGGSTLTMTVRKHPAYGEDVIFDISSGQFTCGTDDCSGTINFGSGPEYISLVEPDDNSSDTLFVSDADTVISRLKKATKVIVELPFYQEGNRQFTFRSKGLNWPPKGAKVDPEPEPSDAIDE